MSKHDGALFQRKRSSGKSGAIRLWMPFVPELDLYWMEKNFSLIRKEKAVPISLRNPRTWRTYSEPEADFCLEIKSSLKFDLKQDDLNIILSNLINSENGI